jgi:hypothetical protein
MVMEMASGHRMVQQVGRANFYGSATVKTITTDFRKLVYANVSAQKAHTASKSTTLFKAMWPYVSTTMFTQSLADRKVRVNRSTAASYTTCIFTYDFIGF